MQREDILLGVNIDHAATLRQARYRDHPRDCGGMVEPDPVSLAMLAERAGADGITVHLREDRRHIQESDVRRLRACIQTRLNLEMACTPEMTAFAAEIKPATVCLVPENLTEVTTEGGLDIRSQKARVAEVVSAMHEVGVKVSLFIDPEPEQVAVAAELKADYIELHTGSFANAFDAGKADGPLESLRRALRQGRELGLTVNAGHGINYVNIKVLRDLDGFHEFNIGHSILARSMFTGIEESVREMKMLMCGGLR